jgi:hypothetical protein
MRRAVGIGAAMALGLLVSTNPANAAPVFTNVAGLKAHAADSPMDIRWRGRGGWGAGAVAAGIIAGLALGGLAVSPYLYRHGPPYGYAPYYYAPYGYGPGYYGFYGYSPSGRFQDTFRNSY